MESILKIKFGHEWNDFSTIRHFILQYIENKIHDHDLANDVAMASNELLENSYKYSTHGGAVIEIFIEQGKLLFNIKNITSPKNIAEFERVLQMANQGEPVETYRNMMIRSFQSHKNQLGLVRIRYEAEGEIEYEVTGKFDEVLSSQLSGEFTDSEDRVLSITVAMAIER